ncbi:MAG: hypothetical protein WB683_00590 [Candidatus Sulfotelmatobacter sp.]
MRVDHVTLERILPRVWEIVSSGVPMVKRCNGAKVYRHSDSIRASDPERDCWPYKGNPFLVQCWGKVAVHINRHRTRPARAFLVLKPQHFASMRKRGDALLSTGISKSPDSRYWRQLYRAALSEIDKSKLPERIAEVEKAVVLRARELFQAAGDNGEETEALDDVMYTLHALRGNYQNLGVS